MRVLLVEDEPRAAQMLAKGLREQAYARGMGTTRCIRRRSPITTPSSST
jgi:DNA-binding response OmpR family regulator